MVAIGILIFAVIFGLIHFASKSESNRGKGLGLPKGGLER